MLYPVLGGHVGIRQRVSDSQDRSAVTRRQVEHPLGCGVLGINPPGQFARTGILRLVAANLPCALRLRGRRWISGISDFLS